MSKSILVVGATGKTGSEVVRLLAAKDIHVLAATRNPTLATPGLPLKAKAIVFNFDRPETFGPALHGVEKVFLMARPADPHSDRAAIPFLEEARRHGVKLIVNLTAIGVERDPTFVLRVLEMYIEESGIPYTHIRPNWFMQNFSSNPMLADIRMTGALHLPAGEAAISFIDVRDVAAVASTVLTESHHTGKSYTLTGGESLTHYQVAEALSRHSGKKISYQPITEDFARETLTNARIAPDVIERWAGFYKMVREGFCAEISRDTEVILGRPPIPFAQYATDYCAVWK